MTNETELSYLIISILLLLIVTFVIAKIGSTRR